MSKPIPEFYRISSKFERRISSALIAAFNAIRSKVTLKEIERAFLVGGIGAVINKFTVMEKVIGKAVLKELTEAVAEGGRRVFTIVPKGAINQLHFFNSLDPNVIRELNVHYIRLVSDISNVTRTAIYQNLEANIVAGNNPRQMAVEIKKMIGLTPNQEAAVRNYRRGLQMGDLSTLESALRDKRFDSSLFRTIQNGGSLSPEKIENMTNRYRERMLKYRATIIARTEAMRAISMGEWQSLNQAEDEGSLTVELLRFWVSAKDERTRYSHREIPRLNAKGVAIKGSFITPRGYLLRYPRDPSAPAEETVNCRCRVIYRVKK